MAKLVVGINDLATLHAEVAAEVDGWDPSTVWVGSHSIKQQICAKGHTWIFSIKERTYGEIDSPDCVEYGLIQVKTLGHI